VHGPASTLGGSFKAPTWPQLPTVQVLDTVVHVLGRDRAALWRRYRDRALSLWEQSGLLFVVHEDDPRAYPKLDLNDPDEDHRLTSAMVQPFLRLMSMPALYGGSIEAVATWYAQTDPAALAAFKMGRVFWANNADSRHFKIAHEIGHCLGLNHQPQAPAVRSVMWAGHDGNAPDDHDLESLRAYYELGGN
jgi:hypothetical protein